MTILLRMTIVMVGAVAARLRAAAGRLGVPIWGFEADFEAVVGWFWAGVPVTSVTVY